MALDQDMLSRIGTVNPLMLQQQLGQAWSLPLGGGGVTLGSLLSSIFGGATGGETTSSSAPATSNAAPMQQGTAPMQQIATPAQPTPTPAPAQAVPDLIRSLGEKLKPFEGIFNNPVG